MPAKRGKGNSKPVQAKRSAPKRSVSRPSKSHHDARHAIKTNMKIVSINLIVFLVLFIISLTLWSVLQGIFQNLFFVFAMGFGVISVAFLITLVVFFFLHVLQKKK
jgi:uncharacterized membrane protein